MLRLLIVDHHGVYRKGMRALLQQQLPACSILECDSLKAARKEFDPDGRLSLVLVDVDRADTSLESLRSMRELYPKTKLVAMSATASRACILRSLDSGLFGCIAKTQPDPEILAAIKDVLAGRIHVPLSLSQVDGGHGAADASDGETGFALRMSHLRAERLTRRQREILPLLAKGMSNKEIARALHIAESTIKIHASAVLRVLGVRNRTQAAVLARDHVGSDEEWPPELERAATAVRKR